MDYATLKGLWTVSEYQIEDVFNVDIDIFWRREPVYKLVLNVKIIIKWLVHALLAFMDMS